MAILSCAVYLFEKKPEELIFYAKIFVEVAIEMIWVFLLFSIPTRKVVLRTAVVFHEMQKKNANFVIMIDPFRQTATLFRNGSY